MVVSLERSHKTEEQRSCMLEPTWNQSLGSHIILWLGHTKSISRQLTSAHRTQQKWDYGPRFSNQVQIRGKAVGLLLSPIHFSSMGSVTMTCLWPSYCHCYWGDFFYLMLGLAKAFPLPLISEDPFPKDLWKTMDQQCNFAIGETEALRSRSIESLPYIAFPFLTSVTFRWENLMLFTHQFSARWVEMLRERKPATLCLCCLSYKQEIPASLARTPPRS